jgi:hydrogenase maturation factor
MAKKKEIIIETWEQKREKELDKFIKDRTEFLPEPTYFYNIGDRVCIGALADVYVVDKILDGKVYEIDYVSTNTNYSNPIKHEHQRRFVSWLDIRPYTEDKSKELINNTDLRLDYSQRSMSDIISKAYYFGIDFEPEYQRDYVWELEDKVALIDSIFNNVDIGKFVFIHLGYSGKYSYEILDGKQRIRAILDFYENRFQYKGKYFNELSLREQDHLEDYPISFAEVRDITREQILRYFVKLNKHGKIMDKVQIEKVEKMIEDMHK